MAISNNSTGLRPGVCTSSTRPTAPYEGQMIYETDTDLTYIWGGSAWQQVSGGTAVGNSGLVYINQFTLSGLTTNLTNIFSSTYDNYRLVVSGVITGAALIDKYQMLNGSTPATGANYNSYRWTTSGAAESNTGQTSGFAMTTGTTAQSWVIEVYNPAIATKTNLNASGQYGANADIAYPELVSSVHTLATAYDGMSLVATATTFTAGKVTVYGYRK